MQYSLAATSFDKTSCIQIMKPFVRTILPNLGFNRNTAQTIIYGSKYYGGFQLAHLYLEQGYLSLKHLLGHLREETITGNQIMIALSCTQLVAGESVHTNAWLPVPQQAYNQIIMDVFGTLQLSALTL
eukprot:13716007-Ditylum_brightwellii.AAC.1